MSESPLVLVTGAARGIGLATAQLFADRGWRVMMLDRDAPELARASATIPDSLAVVADVASGQDVGRVITDIKSAEGGLDALINNAGIADFGPIAETDFARWRKVMDVNLDGVFRLSQAAAPLLKARRGAVVNIASISGLRASTLRVAYGTSKAAVIHLTQQQAVEWGEDGVRANCICPGPVRTKLAMAVHSQAIIDAYHDAIPLNRYGTEAEIAEAIVFLASPAASYITGQCLAVDGGFEAAGVGLPALRAGG